MLTGKLTGKEESREERKKLGYVLYNREGKMVAWLCMSRNNCTSVGQYYVVDYATFKSNRTYHDKLEIFAVSN